MPDIEKVAKVLEDALHAKENYPWAKAEMSFEFIEMLLELLKEQEAKPVEVCGQMFTVKYGHCPTCGKGMDNDTYPHWCGFCGQAVKWE